MLFFLSKGIPFQGNFHVFPEKTRVFFLCYFLLVAGPQSTSAVADLFTCTGLLHSHLLSSLAVRILLVRDLLLNGRFSSGVL